MTMTRQSRGYTLVELLVAMVILVLLLFAVGDAISRTLGNEARDVERIGSSRTTSELGARLREEARSSTAVFVPAVDVNGNANSNGHEVDFFRRASAGGDAFVAYVFDSSSGLVSRVEYSKAGGTASIAHTDVVGSGVAAFSAVRSPDSSMPGVVGDVGQVSILYGNPEVAGGNDVVTVTVQDAAVAGQPAAVSEIHLAPKAAPTSLAVVVPIGAPPPTTPVRRIPFVIIGARPKFPLPHEPFEGAIPGSSSPTFVMRGSVAGLATFFGSGTGLSWLDLSSMESEISDGTYTWLTSTGQRVLLVVSCGESACPIFKPVPISDTSAPPGWVAFAASP